MDTVRELLSKLVITQVMRIPGGYVVYTRVPGTFTEFTFRVDEKEIKGYS